MTIFSIKGDIMKKILSILLITLCLGCLLACNQTESSTESQQKQGSIAFAQSEITLNVGETTTLEIITAKPNVFILWEILDESLATVSTKGEVTALAEGQTFCYAKFQNETVMCRIIILPKQAKPMLSVVVPYEDASVVLYAEDSLDLNLTVKLGDDLVDGAEIEYEVSDEQILSVENGVITAIKTGSATVTVNVTYQEQTASLEINVEVVAKA